MTGSVGLARSPRLMLAIAASYLLDATVLHGFARAGTIVPAVAGWYLIAGLGECLIDALLRYPLAGVVRLRSNQSVMLRLVLCIALQLAFAVAVPQVGFYFLMVLLIVLGLGSMIISSRQAALTLSAVAVLTGAWFCAPLGLHRELVLIP